MSQRIKNLFKFSFVYGSIFYGVPVSFIVTLVFNNVKGNPMFDNWYIFLVVFLIIGFLFGIFRFNQIYGIKEKVKLDDK